MVGTQIALSITDYAIYATCNYDTEHDVDDHVPNSQQ